MDNNCKLKRAVIKEELVSLVTHFCQAGNKKISNPNVTAVILNQFLYWEEKVRDADAFKVEENKRLISAHEKPLELYHGWIYKTAEDLAVETMLNYSVSSMRRHIRYLIDAGFVLERHNPKYEWDRTYQYRTDTIRIRYCLETLNYCLEGYPLLGEDAFSAFSMRENGIREKTDDSGKILEKVAEKPCDSSFSMRENAISTMKNRSSKIKNRSSNIENRNSTIEDRISSIEMQYQRLQSETTTEITTEIISETLNAQPPEIRMVMQAYSAQLKPISTKEEIDEMIQLVHQFGAYKVIQAIGKASSEDDTGGASVQNILHSEKGEGDVGFGKSTNTCRDHFSDYGKTGGTESLWEALPR